MRFGRRTAAQEAQETEPEQDEAPRTGPFDESEIDVEERECIDLGSLMITPAAPMELQLQVDEESGQVLAAVLVNEEGALELRAFASSRGSGAWDELRPQISEETVRLGGSAAEQTGSFGTELLCQVPVQTPDGERSTQTSRVFAHEGPRWLLRATLMGRPAVEGELAEPWEETIRQVVVRRGQDAMPPGTPLPLHLPPEARRVD